jgi:multiple sugar transport system ATP-binding protein
VARVSLQGVRKAFGPVEVIHGIDLEIADGEFVVFVGPSGCGKSTLLRLIAGLEDITSGALFIDGAQVNDFPPKARGVAMVFQSYALYPHMTVFQNMAFGLELGRISRKEIRRRVQKTAEKLQIAPLLDRKPRELSGGQRQRVAIGRAIVRDPKLFLFDEPLSNLDAALRVQTRVEIAKLHAETGATMIYVTHDQVEAMTLADRIVVLNAGRVEQVGAPLELYHRPANCFVAGFIGSPQMNFLEAELESIQPDGVHCNLLDGRSIVVPVSADEVRSGDRVTVGIRPEHLMAGAGDDAALRGTVEVIEQLGDSHLIHVRLQTGHLITVRQAGAALVREGKVIALNVPAGSAHVFDSSGRALQH